MLALSVWNVGGWFAVRRLKLHGTSPVSVAIQQAAARIAQQLGLARGVRLLQSALVDSPLVIGAIKPVILLPASLVTEIPADQLESLLAHELAHVLRHDYLVNLVQTAIETLLFYHPAVWWISSQVRTERESCCDDLAVSIAVDRTVYVRALASVATARPSKMVPAAAGGPLVARLRRILGVVDPAAAHPARWLTGVVILSLCGVAIAFFAVGSRPLKAQVAATQEKTTQHKATQQKTKQDKKTQDSKPEKTAAKQAKPAESKVPQGAAVAATKSRPVWEDPQFPTKGEMKIRTVDAAGKPVPDAFIRVSIWTEENNFRANRNYKSNSQGLATITLPKTLSILRIWASRRGYVEQFHNFETNAQVQELTIPDEFVFHFVKGTSLTGVVKNEQGRPIQGACLECGTQAGRESALTDAQGRWKIDDLGPGAEYEVQATHPDYLGNEVSGEWSKQKVTARETVTEVPTIVMRRGTRAQVRVTDPTGKPLKDVPVIWGDEPYFRLRDTAALTDVNGLCSVPAFPEGPLRITVLAKNWMPDSRKVEIAPKMRPVDFQLRPGKKLRIRFVDRAGTPIPGVTVWVENWRGVRNLSSNVNGKVKFDIPKKSNNQGVFEWDWAPDDPVKYSFGKDGSAHAEPSITADGKEHVQTLDRVLHITGRVRDAVTGREIDNFLAVPVIHFRPDFPSLERNQARKGTGGIFGLELNRTDIEHGVQIEAQGYKTFRTTERYRIGGPDPVLDVRLQPAARYAGRVVGPDGSPLKGASVSISTRLEQLDDGLNEKKAVEDEDDDDSNHHLHTDRNGRFEIPSQLDRYVLVVAAPTGFAEVYRQPDQTPGEIRLQGWASVTGRLLQSGKPVPDCEIYLRPIRLSGGDEPHNFSSLTATTGADGSFVFKRVPPIACTIDAFLHWGSKSPLTSSRSVPIHLAPGEAAHLELGGGGIEVTGQLVAENQPPGFDYHFGLNYLVARRPGITPRDFLAGKGFDVKRGWSDAWRSSQEGRSYLSTLHHWFVKPEPDGRFRISGVEPGDYDFAVALYGTTEGCLVHPVSQGVVHFSVKPGQTQLDLGKVSIPSIALPKVGDLAADFEIETPEGSKTSVAALRGKYVLIDFWATWCGPCVAKLDEVERLRHQFTGNHPLAVVGANLDSDSAQAREFLKSKPLPWQHALLGDWSSTDIPRRYAISNVPAYVLLDPEGRIVVSEYSLEAMEAKLKTLAEKPSGPAANVHEPKPQQPAGATQVALADPSTPKAPEHPRLASEHRTRIQVLDDAGKPVADAQIRVELDTGEKFPNNRVYNCDAHGSTTIDVPATLRPLQIWASQSGFLKDRKAFWAESRSGQMAIPDTVVLHLARPVEIGGIVKDERDRPIAGARVQFKDWETAEPSEVLTDAKGRWHLVVRLVDRMAEHIVVTHPDYVTNPLWAERGKRQDVASPALRSQNAVIVMHAGIPVAGRVTDPSGRPVERAPVIWGIDSKYAQASLTYADKDGRFQFQAEGRAPLKVTVFAKGWMPEQRSIVAAPGMSPTNFQLKAGKKLRMRIVDRSGAPVPGVNVIFGNWRDVNTNGWLRELKLPIHADENGLYEWNWAPDGPLRFILVKSGYANSEVHVTAGGPEQTETIVPVLHISGSVVDARTGRAIDNFNALPVFYSKPDRPQIFRFDARQCKAGRFDVPFDSATTEHGLQIEAPGYRTFRTPHRYRIGEANPNLIVRLEPCDRYLGRVVDGDDRPLKGADILVSSWSEPGSGISLEQLEQGRVWNVHRIKTDHKGAFEIPSPVERYFLQVVSPKGYAEVERAANQLPGQIRIERWAKVTGHVLDSGKPVAKCQVFANPIRLVAPGASRVFSFIGDTTKADGSFVLERVPPVPSAIKTNLSFNVYSSLTSAPSIPMRLVPGETVDVTLGGDATEVTGQCVAENQPANFNHHITLNYLVAKRPGIELSTVLRGKGFDWKHGWTDALLGSPEGNAYLDTLQHWLVMPELDGRFRISGVAPGEYDLALNLYGTVPESAPHPLASRVVHIVVKPGQTRLDLGKLSIRSPAAKVQESTVQKPATRAPTAAVASSTSQAAEHGSRFHSAGHMQVRVVDESGKPLADCLITATVRIGENSRTSRDFKCDAGGAVTFTLPETLDGLRLSASKPGFCKDVKSYNATPEIVGSIIPEHYKFQLVRPVTIGGIVKDETGRAIKGARVLFYDPVTWTKSEAFTDTNGKWQLADVRPGDSLQIRVTHPDYIGDRFGGELQREQNITFAALRSKTAVILMHSGFRVVGTVTDPAGKPVKKAVVRWDWPLNGAEMDRQTVTNDDGRFGFPVREIGPLKVAVIAPGWMPDQRTIRVATGMPAADFRLKPGKKLRVRVVDRSGSPVSDVDVMIAAWRGSFMLYNGRHWDKDDVLHIPRQTDKNGIFEWTWAPDDTVTCELYHPEFAHQEMSLTADDREHTQTLNRFLHLKGSVVDASTGKPIDDFVAVPILYFNGSEFPSLERERARKCTAGRFDVQCIRADVEHGMQIEASGYQTYRTEHRYRIGDANPDLPVRLQPTDRYVGQIVDWHGQPVPAARVFIASAAEQVSPMDLKMLGRTSLDHKVDTNHEGGFEIPSQVERYALVVVSDQGYAEVGRAATAVPGRIQVERWAKVTGRLLQSGKPVIGLITIEPIRVRAVGVPRVFSISQASSQRDGSFIFERVPPIASRINAYLHWATASPLTAAPSVPLQLKPGETVDLTLGGNGIEVTGQLVAENQPANFDYHFAMNSLVAKRPGIAPPDYLAGKGFDWRKGWTDAWRGTPEGQAYLNTLRHWFVKPEPDGHFRISGLEPGDYDLGVALYGSTEGCLVHPVSSGVVHFSVKSAEKQLDLGKLSIPSLTPPKVGDLAGSFDFQKPDGEKTSVAALRGNYVLIDFWATWCGVCVAKLDEVEHLRNQFAGDRPLVVIGANLDADTSRAREFLKSKPLPWQHAFLGDWSSTDVPRRYAVSNVPAYVLIDPNGRILANEYSLNAIEAKLNSLGDKRPTHKRNGAERK